MPKTDIMQRILVYDVKMQVTINLDQPKKPKQQQQQGQEEEG